VALYAFTPIYPRLVFSLTYNIVFAVAQIGFASMALLIVRFNRSMSRLQTVNQSATSELTI